MAAKAEEAKAAEPQIDTHGMTSVLANSTNAKHRNCEFLKFLRQIETGALKIEEKEGASDLVVDADKMAQFEQSEVVRLQEEAVRQEEDAKFAQ